MVWLRALVVVGCIGGATAAAATAPWEARLVHGSKTYYMQLGRHPLWRPPPAPEYEAFREYYIGRDAFPPPGRASRLFVAYDLAGVGVEAVAYCWPVLMLCGLIYLTRRGPRRDLVLHCAMNVGWGVIVAGVACVALWVVRGGWRPPFVGGFVVLAVFGGVLSGLMTFADAVPEPADVPPRG